MRIISAQKTSHTDVAMDLASRLTGLTNILGGALLVTLLLNSSLALGATAPTSYTVNLAWDANPESDVVGYRVHYGTTSGNYTASVEAGNLTTNAIPGLASGVTYFFAITAFNASGLNSGFSNEITFMPGLQTAPTASLSILSTGQIVMTIHGQMGHTYEIQASQDLITWTIIGSGTMGNGGSLEFTDTNAAAYSTRFYRTYDTQP